ncbi:MAG: exonuclease SbcC [Phenylobacterium sp.]|jgi:exonuclease SbcC
MIFKKLFKPFIKPFTKPFEAPEWEHENPQVRIKALRALSVDEPKHKTILHELAFNDGSEKVRGLALERLNDFSLWWQASKSEKGPKLKKLAEQNIRQGLLGKASFVVDDTLKNQFIDQCNKASLLEELALKDDDEKTRFKLLEKLNKPQLLMQSIQDSDTSVWLKTALIEKLDDLPLLEKLNKKSDDSVKGLLSSKIDLLKSALEKPLKMRKDVGLMLAKLNALKDKADIEEIERRQAQLTLEWETLQQSFELLADDEVAELKAKYDKISTSLSTIVAPLKEKWLAQQAVVADAQEKAANQATVAERLAAVEVLLTSAISAQNEAADDHYSQPLKQIQQELQQLNLAVSVKAGFVGRIEQFQHKISQIPLIIECVSQAKQLIAQLETLPIPTGIDELATMAPPYKEWQQQWRDNQTKMGLALPEAITSQYQQLTGQWKTATAPLQKSQDQLFAQARKGLADLKHLLAGGKYRRAFGLFKKVNENHEQLNESQQSKLARDFDTVKSEIEKLADLQEYIATPRKQQILEEMTELVENPLSSPQEQAKKVRFIRQNWNSLGKTPAGSDDSIDQQFNDACEKAFEPCRVFYAEQETLRAANLETKQAICEKLSEAYAMLPTELSNGLSTEQVPWQQLESALSQARKAWRSSGDVDKEQVEAINKRYFELLNPIQAAVKSRQTDNATLKENLIDKAKALLEIEDVFDATNQIKDFQAKWKDIGFSGGKTDNVLWRKFREVNDAIFSKRDEVKQQRNDENQQQLDELSDQLSAIEGQILNADEMSVLTQNASTLQNVMAQLNDAPKHVQTKLSSQAQALQSLINTRKTEIKETAARDAYVNLFSQFEYLSKHGELNIEVASTSAWNDRLTAIDASNSDASLRYDLTIGLEIAMGIESPVRDTDRRMELQMAMLSNKMSGGQQQAAQSDELLKEWLAVGRLTDDEVELLERVKAIFLV